MRIGMIGAGHIGANAARLFVKAGHEVGISNSRGAETLKELAEGIGAIAMDVSGASAFGDVIMVSIPLKAYKSLSPSELAGKIVIDSNNYYPERDGQIEELDARTATSSELLARHLSESRIVKAFNTIWFEHLRTEGDTEKPVTERRVIFVSGDDREAKKLVSGLIEDIGFSAYDLGGIKDSGIQQPGSVIYNKSVNRSEAERILAEQ